MRSHEQHDYLSRYCLRNCLHKSLKFCQINQSICHLIYACLSLGQIWRKCWQTRWEKMDWFSGTWRGIVAIRLVIWQTQSAWFCGFPGQSFPRLPLIRETSWTCAKWPFGGLWTAAQKQIITGRYWWDQGTKRGVIDVLSANMTPDSNRATV